MKWLRSLWRLLRRPVLGPRYTVWWCEVTEIEIEPGISVTLAYSRCATYPDAQTLDQALAMHRSDYPGTNIHHVTWYE